MCDGRSRNLAGGQTVRPAPARIGNGSRQRWRKRQTALHGKNSIYLPTAKDRIRKGVRNPEAPSLPERQIVNYALRSPMLDIKSTRSAIQETIADILWHRAVCSSSLLQRHVVD